ncbi:MAG: Clp protease ClpP [Tannerella sp.]|jgi:ATP-dependent protease ClpP protease subunit|nr:Clp protease ClpP [Tannerella sp.]
MAKYDIDIDGYIGSWFSSKRYIKNVIKEINAKEIRCRVNSLGGNVDDAIDIAAQFAAHGNVTCELFSLNASAATVFTLGAKKVRMHTNSMYLIHKALSWVNEWGYMNEDQITEAIQKMTAEKDRNSAITLTLANMYAKKSGKEVKDILNLMKQEKWLTATEAKEWGFVDEIFEDNSVQPADTRSTDFLNLLNAAGLPVPNFIEPEHKEEKEQLLESGMFKEFINALKSLFNNQNNTVFMKKDLVNINTLLDVKGIELKNGKAELTEAQLQAINTALDAAKNTAEPEEKKDEKTEETPVPENSADKDEIARLKAEIEALKKQPGDTTAPVNKVSDDTTEEADYFAHVKSAKNMFDMLP